MLVFHSVESQVLKMYEEKDNNSENLNAISDEQEKKEPIIANPGDGNNGSSDAENESAQMSGQSSKRGIRSVLSGKNIAAGVFFFITNIVIVAFGWKLIYFNTVDMSAMIFQLKVPLGGADATNFYSLFIGMLVGGILMLVSEMTILERLLKKCERTKEKGKFITFFQKHYSLIVGLLMGVVIIVVLLLLRFPQYVIRQMTNSTFYDDYYVDPEQVEIIAPEKKRNLVYIYLESMEIAYSDIQHGGICKKDLMPELTELAVSGINFMPAGSDSLNGALMMTGMTYTMGSLVAQTSGTPAILPIAQNAMGKADYQEFLPGLYTIGEVLRKNGYQLCFLIDSSIEFSGCDIYVGTHGNYDVRDYNYYLKNGTLPEGYKEWWGFEDEKLFAYAKEEIQRMYEQDEPFCLTMMTMDTHFTDGYKCRLCGDEFPEQYSNVIACSSRQVSEFVTWLSEQPFYDDTTIVLVGDHPTMDSEFISSRSGYKRNMKRKSYLSILNSATEYTLNRKREFTQLDMYPTTLTAMGFTVVGDKLGIGVNLFSDTPTVLEQFGFNEMKKQLEMHSRFYDANIIYKHKQ